MRKRWTAVCLAALAPACGAPEIPNETPSEAPEVTESAAVINQRLEGRPCRSDLFFFERPVWADPFPPPYRFAFEFNANANTQANWFCANAACSVSPIAVTAHVVPLLPDRPGTPSSDAGTRFYRVFFTNNANNQRVKARSTSVCEVMRMLRDQSSLAVGSTTMPTRFGRECDVTAMGLAPFATAEGKSWHWTRLGVSATPPAFSVTTDPIDLALIDSGVPDELETILHVDDKGSFVEGALGTNNGVRLASHGAEMATYLRHLAPNVSLDSYRVIDEQGVATIGSLAQAMDAAIFDTSTSPLVMNVSMGFPPELGHPATLRSGACMVTESALGESIRFMTHVAGQIDQTGTRRISIFAAAGNRAARVEPATETAIFYSQPSDPSMCQAGTFDNLPPGAPANFFPAAFDDLKTCRKSMVGPGFTPLKSTVTAVGAVDSTDGRSGFTIVAAEAALVAPGEHVFIDRADMPEDEAELACKSQSGYDEFFQFPSELSGSSVSTALVSGAAARAQAALVAKGEPPMRSPSLSRLLYLTGEPVCRNRPVDGTPIRRLSVAQLDHAIASCDSLVDCARSSGNNLDPIGPSTYSNCEDEVEACLLTTTCTAMQPVQSWPADLIQRLEGPLTDPNHIRQETGCVTNQCAGTACGPLVKTAPTAIDRFLIGSLGVQPGRPACPDCQGGGGQMQNAVGDAPVLFDLVASLNPGFEPGLAITQPRLVVYDDVKNEVVSADLLKYTNPSQWAIGHTLIIKDVDLTDECDGDTDCEDALELLVSSPQSFHVFLETVMVQGTVQSLDHSAIKLE